MEDRVGTKNFRPHAYQCDNQISYYNGQTIGRLAQWQRIGLLIRWFWVRVPGRPFSIAFLLLGPLKAAHPPEEEKGDRHDHANDPIRRAIILGLHRIVEGQGQGLGAAGNIPRHH